jgi:hypothetical protein
MRALIWIAALFVTGCSAGFWDLNSPQRIALDPALIGRLSVQAVEVRSAAINPPDAFSEVFAPAVMARTGDCLKGARGVRAVIFIHQLDRGSALTEGGDRIVLSGEVDVVDGRSKVVARFPVRVDVPMVPGDVSARRRAAADAFGQEVCRELTGG